MDTLDLLLSIEAIRSLKARYCIAVDTKDTALLGSVLAVDAVADFSQALTPPGSTSPAHPAIREPLSGRDAIVAAIVRAVAPQVTVHHCSLGDIVIESPTEARATWPVVDRLRRPRGSPVPDFVGYGYYHETYVRTDGSWMIATIAMSRLRIDAPAVAV